MDNDKFKVDSMRVDVVDGEEIDFPACKTAFRSAKPVAMYPSDFNPKAGTIWVVLMEGLDKAYSIPSKVGK